jgi:hypothetical protein
VYIGDKIEELKKKVEGFDKYSDYQDILKVQNQALDLFEEARLHAYEDEIIIILHKTDDLIESVLN